MTITHADEIASSGKDAISVESPSARRGADYLVVGGSPEQYPQSLQ